MLLKMVSAQDIGALTLQNLELVCTETTVYGMIINFIQG